MIKMKDCIIEANKLMTKNNNKGKICYVQFIGNRFIGHAYYVPDPLNLDAIALNHEDNGFPQYPKLTARESLKHHNPSYLLMRFI